MPGLLSCVSGALFGIMLLAGPLAAHLTLVMHRGVLLAGILIAIQAALVTWVALSPITGRLWRLSACAGAVLLVLVLARFTDDGPIIAAAVPHAMAYLALLAVFAASLGPGREPVATILARRMRGQLPAEIVQYTRRVTWAWCWFFVAQLLASLLLLLFAPIEIWSWFINLGNLPLIAVMFGSEYAYRRWRHATRPPQRLVDMLRIFRQTRMVPINEDR